MLHPVAGGGKTFATFRAKQDADLPAIENLVVADEVLVVPVTNGNTALGAVADHVLLRQAILDTPAEEEADAVAFENIIANDRSFRPGTGVQAQAGIIAALTVFHPYVMADLPADTVAVVVAGDDVADQNAAAVLDPDAAA